MNLTKAAPNEIVTTRLLNAPRDLVFRVWNDPAHLTNWWGPNGFNITTASRDFRVGGSWIFTMHGPDGTNYPNRVRYRDIVAPERIAYLHDDGTDAENAISFESIVTFEECAGCTLVTMRLRMASAEKIAEIKGYAVEGGRQTLGRFAALLATQTGNATAGKPFTISRTVNAPRDLVWQVYTDPAHLSKWFGPKGFPMMSNCEMDLQAGGSFHYGLTMPNGQAMWGLWKILEITPPSRFVVITMFSDPDRGATRHPMNPDWPLQTIGETTFEEVDGKTMITVSWRAFDESPVSQQVFNTSHDSMRMGWSGTFEQLDAYLAEIQG